MSSLITFLMPGRYDETADPAEYGFQVVQVEPVSEKDVIKSYLEYLRTGGPPISAWERKLRLLRSSGELQAIEAEVNAQHSALMEE